MSGGGGGSPLSAIPILGGFIQGYGYMRQQSALISAHEADALEYERQAVYAEQVGQRKLNLLGQDQDEFLDRKKAMFARAGVGFGEQFNFDLSHDQVNMNMEKAALKAEIESEVRGLRLRAGQARSARAQAADQTMNFLNLTGILFGAGGQAAQMSNKGGSTSYQPSSGGGGGGGGRGPSMNSGGYD